MKKHFTLFASLLLSLSVQASWEYDRVTEKNSVQFSAYSFDHNFDNSVTLSCTHDMNQVILAIMPSESMSSKQQNVLSFTFDDLKKIKLKSSK